MKRQKERGRGWPGAFVFALLFVVCFFVKLSVCVCGCSFFLLFLLLSLPSCKFFLVFSCAFSKLLFASLSAFLLLRTGSLGVGFFSVGCFNILCDAVLFPFCVKSNPCFSSSEYLVYFFWVCV